MKERQPSELARGSSKGKRTMGDLTPEERRLLRDAPKIIRAAERLIQDGVNRQLEKRAERARALLPLRRREALLEALEKLRGPCSPAAGEGSGAVSGEGSGAGPAGDPAPGTVKGRPAGS
ncbi:MAG: hypothetical protein LBW85_10285 [Deltaproteobacteria bacterium]|jgi:hypothetical protein|nr:hypothetical protein [Deltaproteobacteria bacterium]